MTDNDFAFQIFGKYRVGNVSWILDFIGLVTKPQVLLGGVSSVNKSFIGFGSRLRRHLCMNFVHSMFLNWLLVPKLVNEFVENILTISF